MADDFENILKEMKLNPDPIKENDDNDDNEESADTVDDMVDVYAAEYANLDSSLDQLGSCLDTMEAKNDDLYSRMQALLEETRQTRIEIQAQRQLQEGSDTQSNDQKKNDG